MRFRGTARTRIAAAAAAAAMVASFLPALAPPVHAAAPEVPITSVTTYRVIPDQNVIQVVVDATLVNRIRDTATTRYYVNDAYLALLPGAAGLRATGPGGRQLAVSVTERHEDYVVGRIRLSANVFSGQSYRFTLAYDLPGVGDGAAPFTHSDESFASFPVWAHSTAETPGNRVVVIIPAGYEVGVTFGDLPQPTTGAGGELVYDFGVVADADTFFAFFSAKRYAGLATVEIEADVGDETVRVLLRGWADDPGWLDDVGPVVEEGLPALGELIGLPYPGVGTLYVDETVSWLIDGYAGIYDASTGTIEVSELADEFVTLHEAAHTWFNGALVVDRWIAEGFADYYAGEAATVLGIDYSAWAPAEPGEIRFPLTEWPPLDRAEDEAEFYGYRASQWAAYLIGQRAGIEGLAAVWAAVDDHQVAYQPANADEPEVSGQVGPADARELLDQLEELTGERFDDIWLAWVFPVEDAPEMRQRSDARQTYEDLVDDAGTWNLPRDLRRALDDWRFEDAEQEMTSAGEVLDTWADVTEAAEALDLSPTDSVETDFEDGDWDAASAGASAELEALEHLTDADAAVAVEPDVLESVGLIGEDLVTDLAAAEEAYENGDLGTATGGADDVTETRLAARDAGALRVAVGGGLLVVVAGSAGGIWFVRRRRSATAPDAAIAPDRDGEPAANGGSGAEDSDAPREDTDAGAENASAGAENARAGADDADAPGKEADAGAENARAGADDASAGADDASAPAEVTEDAATES